MRQLFILCLLIFPIVAFSQEIIDTNSVVIAWDEVTMLVDGTAIPSEDTVEYEIVYAAQGDRNNLVIVGQTPELEYTITFSQEDIYEIGVRAVRTSALGESISDIAWSVDYNFVVRYLIAPEPPEGLRVP